MVSDGLVFFGANLRWGGDKEWTITRRFVYLPQVRWTTSMSSFSGWLFDSPHRFHTDQGGPVWNARLVCQPKCPTEKIFWGYSISQWMMGLNPPFLLNNIGKSVTVRSSQIPDGTEMIENEVKQLVMLGGLPAWYMNVLTTLILCPFCHFRNPKQMESFINFQPCSWFSHAGCQIGAIESFAYQAICDPIGKMSAMSNVFRWSSNLWKPPTNFPWYGMILKQIVEVYHLLSSYIWSNYNISPT